MMYHEHHYPFKLRTNVKIHTVLSGTWLRNQKIKTLVLPNITGRTKTVRNGDS
jgi:hypothetical protein